MLSFSLDMSELVKTIDWVVSTGDAFRSVLAIELTAFFREQVIAKAGTVLSSRTVNRYIDGLSEVKITPEGAELELAEGLPTWIEEGKEAHVMKGDGHIVPFFFWPKTQGWQKKKHGGSYVNPKILKRMLDKQFRTTPGVHFRKAGGKAPGWKVRQFTRRNPQSGEKEKVGDWRGRVNASDIGKKRPWHKHSMQHSMYRIRSSRKDMASPFGITFRTNDGTWQHPGIKAHKFFEIAGRRVDENLSSIANRLFRELFG